jgi:hypothetical protein
MTAVITTAVHYAAVHCQAHIMNFQLRHCCTSQCYCTTTHYTVTITHYTVTVPLFITLSPLYHNTATYCTIYCTLRIIIVYYRDVVMEEEGPEMREQLREERTLWVTDQIAQDKFPDDLVPFYLLKVMTCHTHSKHIAHTLCCMIAAAAVRKRCYCSVCECIQSTSCQH